MGLFNKIKKLNIFSGLFSVDEDFFEELEETLILADLGMDTALDAVEKLRTRSGRRSSRTRRRSRPPSGTFWRRRWTWAARSWISRPGLLWCCSSASTA